MASTATADGPRVRPGSTGYATPGAGCCGWRPHGVGRGRWPAPPWRSCPTPQRPPTPSDGPPSLPSAPPGDRPNPPNAGDTADGASWVNGCHTRQAQQSVTDEVSPQVYRAWRDPTIATADPK